ncbi:hypothetical protein CANCADRAFT_3362 [Tortispora caseinolytica NRRL Y-17796]|uniref:UBC core domain-containing protein n=1 Tax=Tortispora caseinolytica NRRL Y-17796 TaxID=767744 RepID=A0A1E4TAA5_9ASCO|nr:hypothetical protein CANCADRAFT_3362 [Tortispora caseinolytica NRRL Y-17796]
MSPGRLLRELGQAQNELPEGVIALEVVDDADLYHWTAQIEGPPSSPFENTIFDLTITVPDQYPIKPPTFNFKNRISHPNIDFKTGDICLDVLSDKWSPAWTLASALVAIRQLLGSPEPDSPLNVDSANLWRSGDTSAINALTRYYIEKYN